jgi:hypothetical protein
MFTLKTSSCETEHFISREDAKKVPSQLRVLATLRKIIIPSLNFPTNMALIKIFRNACKFTVKSGLCLGYKSKSTLR